MLALRAGGPGLPLGRRHVERPTPASALRRAELVLLCARADPNSSPQPTVSPVAVFLYARPALSPARAKAPSPHVARVGSLVSPAPAARPTSPWYYGSIPRLPPAARPIASLGGKPVIVEKKQRAHPARRAVGACHPKPRRYDRSARALNLLAELSAAAPERGWRCPWS